MVKLDGSTRLSELMDDELSLLIRGTLSILLQDSEFFMRHPEKLKKAIDRLHEYCDECGLRHESLIKSDQGGGTNV